MSYEISVGPAQLTINVGDCVLITDTDGAVRPPGERGLFFRDTRLLDAWEVRVDGRPWELLSSAATAHYAAQVVLGNPALPRDGQPRGTVEVPAGSMSLTLSRLLGQGGMRETLELRNHNRVAVRVTLSVRSCCDFADIFDVKSHRLVERGRTASSWHADEGRLETVHENGTFRRGLSIGPDAGTEPPVLRDGALCFTVEVPPQGRWRGGLAYRVLDGTTLLDAPEADYAGREGSGQARALATWCEQALRLRTPHDGLRRLYEQSVDDLAALRLPIEGTDLQEFVPAAGIPWFAALFGRDSLIAALQTVPVLSGLRPRRAGRAGAPPGGRHGRQRATCSRARSRTSCGGASSPSSGWCPTGRTTARRTRRRST